MVKSFYQLIEAVLQTPMECSSDENYKLFYLFKYIPEMLRCYIEIRIHKNEFGLFLLKESFQSNYKHRYVYDALNEVCTTDVVLN